MMQWTFFNDDNHIYQEHQMNSISWRYFKLCKPTSQVLPHYLYNHWIPVQSVFPRHQTRDPQTEMVERTYGVATLQDIALFLWLEFVLHFKCNKVNVTRSSSRRSSNLFSWMARQSPPLPGALTASMCLLSIEKEIWFTCTGMTVSIRMKISDRLMKCASMELYPLLPGAQDVLLSWLSRTMRQFLNQASV